MNRASRRRAAAAKRPVRVKTAELLPLVAGVLTLLAVTAAYLWVLGVASPPPPAVGGHWTLTRSDGTTVSDRDFRGRYVLLYFGYTACPDICPTTLDAVADAMRLLGRRADRLQPLFVTVDPERDTPTVVGDYVRLFGARLVGLTGTPSEIATIKQEFRIHSVRMKGMSALGAPMIDHTAVLLLLGPDGQYLAPLPPDESGKEIATKLERYLS